MKTIIGIDWSEQKHCVHLYNEEGARLSRFEIEHSVVGFLDAMADRILLRRRGGGWVFIHRYLLEYFASLKEPEIE